MTPGSAADELDHAHGEGDAAAALNSVQVERTSGTSSTPAVHESGQEQAASSQPPLRLLYIHPDTMGLSTTPARNPLSYLSLYFTGDYLAVWIVPDDEAALREAEAVNRASGRFRFHWIRRNRLPRAVQRLLQVGFYIFRARRLARERGRYDVIVAYGPFTTALAGLVVGRLTRTPVIIEFPGHPFRGFELHGGRLNRLKLKLAPAWTRFVARRADRVRLLYPDQLADLGEDFSAKASVFHDFTTVASAADYQPPRVADGRYVLFMGFPYHLKGVDVLIRAFSRISDRFPEHRLLLVGHCPDPAPYYALAAGNPRVEIRRPLPHDAAMQLMAGCSAFVLPSRTEAMGRVLLEAMAFGRPIVASRVGGIPHYVRDGETGLLFESEDVDGLAARLARVLSDPALAARLGRAARSHVLKYLSEDMYASCFFNMANLTIRSSSKPRATSG
jgi:glycosyltransferase involved in cell wall biosynthesis